MVFTTPSVRLVGRSELLKQLGVELFHDPEVHDYRLDVAVVFLLGERDAAEL